jgi:hypothetical protein
MLRRTWFETPRGWRYVDLVDRPVGLGWDPLTLIPGYVAYKTLSGTTFSDLHDQIAVGSYVLAQVNAAALRCAYSSNDLSVALSNLQAAIAVAQTAYDAQPVSDRLTVDAPATTMSNLKGAITALVGASQAMARKNCPVDLSSPPKGGSVLSLAQQYTGLGPGAGVLCPDGSDPPGGDLSKCATPTDWKTIAIWAGAGLGALLVGVAVYKAVSD